MRSLAPALMFLVLGISLQAGCGPRVSASRPCNSGEDCASGERCAAGVCRAGAGGFGVPDGGRPPSGERDAGPRDDAGPVEGDGGRAPDAGRTADGGPQDAGPRDGGPREAGPLPNDAGLPDGGDAPDDAAVPDAGGLPWWSDAWQSRFVVEQTSPTDEVLSRFPVLLRISASHPVRSRAAEDGRDVRFVTTDGEVLPHEIESWAPGEEALVWVRAPELSTSPGALFHLYAGNPNAADAQEPGAVWSNGYQGVWHLAGDARDSSPTGLHGVTSAVVAPGAVGEGLSFDGTTRVDLGLDLPVVRSVAGASVSAWVRRDGPVEDEVYLLSLGRAGAPSGISRLSLGFVGGALRAIARAPDLGGFSQPTGASVPGGALVHVAVSVDVAGDAAAFFVDGSPAGTGVFGFTAPVTDDTPCASGALASEDDQLLSPFVGVLDEVRLSAVARSAAWTDAEHRSMTTGLVRLGTEEPR